MRIWISTYCNRTGSTDICVVAAAHTTAGNYRAMTRTSIWINEGCIQCFWCQNLEPEVFSVTADGCEIRAEARTDRCADPNRVGRSRLNDGLVTEENIGFIQFVADGCPAKVIMIETDIQVEATM